MAFKEMDRAASLLRQAVNHHAAGELDEAEALYTRILAAEPVHPHALHGLGVLALQRRDSARALSLLLQAKASCPEDAQVHSNLAAALLETERFEEAVSACRQALALDPGRLEAGENLAAASQELGRYEDAHAALAEVLQRRPDRVPAVYAEALLLRDEERFREAADAFARVTRLQPDHLEAHVHLGHLLARQKRHPEALEAYDRALALRPGFGPALGGAVLATLCLCRWERLRELLPALLRNMEHDCDGVSPHVLLLLHTTLEEQSTRARGWSRRKADKIAALPAQSRQRRSVDRIHVAYFSSDLRAHPVGHIMADLLPYHNRDLFRITVYATDRTPDNPVRRAIARCCDRLTDLSRTTNAEAAHTIRDDGVDILVDLNGHTGGERMAVGAYRPASLQLAWLGYPGTTGAPWIDYLLIDPVLVKPGEEAFFSEKTVVLPTFLAAAPLSSLPAPTRRDCGLPEDAFVFCAFCQPKKILPEIFDVWLSLLDSIPRSLLWLRASDAKTNLRAYARRHGVDPARLIFAHFAPSRRAHLARYLVADLALDTHPYAGHGTTLDTLRAGCPVVTLMGDTVCGRASASMLRTLGLSELIATTLDGYAWTTRRLAEDRSELARLRARLAASLLASLLTDCAAFVRHLETSFMQMLAKHRRGEAPAGFAVARGGEATYDELVGNEAIPPAGEKTDDRGRGQA